MPAKPEKKSKRPAAATLAGAEPRPKARNSAKTGTKGSAPTQSVAAKRQPKSKPDARFLKKQAQKQSKARKGASSSPAATLDPGIVTEMFSRFSAANPAPKGELEHVNAFTLLVAVVLSAQATDAGVNKATRELFRLADTPEKMVALGEDRVRDLIKTIGLFRNKAKNTVLLSAALIANHGGEVPRDRESLEALPGVGRKTANVVLNSAFGEPTIAVDTHLFRLANRLSLAPGKTPLEVELKLLEVIPKEFLLNAHHWLILHGRYVCKAQRPSCGSCVIADLCTSKDKVV